jgi:8-oxo-dGTP diphosphatase
MARSGESAVSFTYEFARPALTVDLIVVTTEPIPRVLLIQRRDEPYVGQWALPGGFVDENEPLEQAARRELAEETGLNLSTLQQFATFGDPGRDPRGWTVSVVYFCRLSGSTPMVQAGDDAQNVGWFPVGNLPPLAFDHKHIIEQARVKLKL